MNQIQAEELSALAGMLLSLGFSYLPGLSSRFARLSPTQKRLVMLGLLFACTLGIFGLSCLRPELTPGLSCREGDAWDLLRVFVMALVANQAAFGVTPKREADR